LAFSRGCAFHKIGVFLPSSLGLSGFTPPPFALLMNLSPLFPLEVDWCAVCRIGRYLVLSPNWQGCGIFLTLRVGEKVDPNGHFLSLVTPLVFSFPEFLVTLVSRAPTFSPHFVFFTPPLFHFFFRNWLHSVFRLYTRSAQMPTFFFTVLFWRGAWITPRFFCFLFAFYLPQ